MALGLSIPYDNLVKNQCDQLHSRFEDYASEAKQQNFLGTLDDFLGSRGHQRQNIESFVKFWSNSDRYFSNANVSIFFVENLWINWK